MSTEKLKEKLGELEEALAFAEHTRVLSDEATLLQIYDTGLYTYFRAVGDDEVLIWYPEDRPELYEEIIDFDDDEAAICQFLTEENMTDRHPIRMLGAYLLGELREE